MKYEADLYDGSTLIATEGFVTIGDARRWAEGHGTLADRCVIRLIAAYDQPVAEHRRDRSSYHWFKAPR